MSYKLQVLTFLVGTSFFISGCTQKSFHNEMIENAKNNVKKEDYNNFKQSYSETLVDEKTVKKEYVSVLEEKTLSTVLKELELLDGNYYFLKSNDIVIPTSRMKINNLSILNKYLKAVLEKELFVKKSGGIFLVKLLNTSETKKVSIEKLPFQLEGELSIEELTKLMTKTTGFEFSIGQNIKDKAKFLDSIVSIKCENILDAVSSLSSAKNIYVDIDYDNETFEIRRYKDIVIELNIPMLNLQSSNQTSSSETAGESKVQNTSSIILYDELNSMLKSIISDDTISTYHIDKASGLIYLKSTKNVENAVRTIAKAYEDTFSKEAIIEFERIELVLNKGMEYGISSIIDNRQTAAASTDGVVRNITNGVLSFSSNNLVRDLTIEGKLNNEIGRILNYSRNLMVLKNNIPTVQSTSQNTDYIEKIETTTDANTGNVTSDVTVNTIKDGTAITAQAKVSRDKIFLNITPSIKKLIDLNAGTQINGTSIALPQYNDQSYNISREIRLGETAIVGSIIVHDDAKEYEGILPVESFAIGGTDSNSYVRREIVYIVTLRSIKGF